MATSGIDVTAPAPRVNFELMSHYIGKRVKLVGRVENGGVQNGVLKVKAADEGTVDVIVHSAVPQDLFVEVDGTVESPNTIREDSIIGFGNSFGKFALPTPSLSQTSSLSLKHSTNTHISDIFKSIHSFFAADMGNYNEVCKLMNGPHTALFI